MNPMLTRAAGAVAVSLAAGLLAAPRVAQTRPRVPTVTVLGVLPTSTYASGQAINQRGDISGYGGFNPTETRALLYSKGKPTPKGLPADGSAEDWEATGLSDKGDAVGTAYSSVDGPRAVFWKWKATVPTLLPSLAGGKNTLGADVNSRGEAVGTSDRAGDLNAHAVLWDKRRQITALPVPAEAVDTFAAGISNAGVIVGHGNSDVAVETRGLRWLNKTAQPQLLGTLSGDRASRSFAVNNKGLAVGVSEAQNGSWRAVFWAAGSTTPTVLLNIAGATHTAALGVNDRGDVVGYTSIDSGSPIAILWPGGGGTPVDLNTYAPAGSDLHLSRAVAINNKRQIVVQGEQGMDARAILVKM